MPGPLVIPMIISAAASLGQAVSGYARKRKAQKALERFRRQNLQNVTKGMRASTLGAELDAKNQARRFATSVDALQGAGVRGLVGGLGRQEMISDVSGQRRAASLDQQQMMIERMRAQDEARMRQMQEARESGAIAGLGNEISQGANQMMQGTMGLAQTAVAAGQAGLFDKSGGEVGGKGSAGSDIQTNAFKSPNTTTNVTNPEALQTARNYFGNMGDPFARTPNSSSVLTSGLTGSVDPVYIDQFSTQGISFTNKP